MKIEIDFNRFIKFISNHMTVTRFWGSITTGLLQFILLGSRKDFYVSLLPWAAFCLINCLSEASK